MAVPVAQEGRDSGGGGGGGWLAGAPAGWWSRFITSICAVEHNLRGCVQSFKAYRSDEASAAQLSKSRSGVDGLVERA